METIRIVVTTAEYKQIITALLAHQGCAGIDLIHKMHEQDPADDGPEVEILKP